MQIRKISFGFANTALGVAHAAIAVFTFGDSLQSSDSFGQHQSDCALALGDSSASVHEALELAKTVEFSAKLGHVIVSRASEPNTATVYVVGLGQTTPHDGIGTGDYQRALEELIDFVIGREAPIELLTVVLPPFAMPSVKPSEVARLTSLWIIHSLAGPFDTKYGEYASRSKRDLDLLLIVENDGEDQSEISKRIREGARTAAQLLAQRDQLICPHDPARVQLEEECA